jgi:hypothetical protein
MGQYLNVNGDYNIKTAEGSTIVLDTGPGVGNTRVTGNLVVEGGTFNVSAENLNIKDNIIILNDGEIGTVFDPGNPLLEQGGVTLRFSGIQVDRGPSLSPASFIFDELDNSWNIAFGTPGSYNLSDSNLKLRTILTNQFVDNGDLTLIGTGTGVVKVFGTVNYEDQVVNDDDVPNKKYVDDAIQNNPTFQILADRTGSATRVIIADRDLDANPLDPTITGSTAYFEAETNYSTFGESSVTIIVDDNFPVAQFFSNRAVVGGIEFLNNEISNNDTNTNIVIKTNGTGKLETNYALQLNSIGTDPNTSAGVPGVVADATIIYSSEPRVGTTGVWFVNNSDVTNHRNGELISKNKALVFSMIF